MIGTTRKVKTTNELERLLDGKSIQDCITGIFYTPLIVTANFSVHLASEAFPKDENMSTDNYRVTFHHANKDDVVEYALFPYEVEKLIADHIKS